MLGRIEIFSDVVDDERCLGSVVAHGSDIQRIPIEDDPHFRELGGGLALVRLRLKKSGGRLGLLPGFLDGSLKAFEVDDAAMVPFEQAAQGYRRVLEGSVDRSVLAP